MKEYQLIWLSSEYQLSDQTNMHFMEVQSEQKTSLLIYILMNKVLHNEQVIIFVSTKYTVDYLEAILNEHFPKKGSFLYSKMDMEQRQYNLERFWNNEA